MIRPVEAFGLLALGVLLLSPSLGCTQLSAVSGSSRPSASSAPSSRSLDGLERVEIDMPGVLELRTNHRIGGYDQFLIPKATLSYERNSLRLTREAQSVFLSLLRTSLVNASTAAGIPIVSKPGPCTMEVELDVVDLDLDLAHAKTDLAQLTVVMQFRDSMSRQRLLRYAASDHVTKPADGADTDSKLQQGFDRVVADMDLAPALRGSGLADDAIIPGCSGRLAALGRAASGQ